MPEPIDHFAEAERILAATDGIVLEHDGGSPEAALMIAEAQAHATLALVVATRDQAEYVASTIDRAVQNRWP